MFRFLPFFLAVPLLGADNQIQRLTERLSEEAAAFQRIAPQLLGRETLEQKARKTSSRFRIRVADSTRAPEQPEWLTRTLVSEYGYTTFAGGALHELRQVVSVDGKPVKDNKGSQELARVMATSDEKRKQELLKTFNGYGLLGAVNDFGQIILLFSTRGIVRYEFVFRGGEFVDGAGILVFTYRQIDGPNALTVVDAGGDHAKEVRMQGEVWVRANNYLPVRVTMASAERQKNRTVRHEATVNYAPSEYGTLLPVSMHHREIWDDSVVAENDVHYEGFKKFGADQQK